MGPDGSWVRGPTPVEGSGSSEGEGNSAYSDSYRRWPHPELNKDSNLLCANTLHSTCKLREWDDFHDANRYL